MKRAAAIQIRHVVAAIQAQNNDHTCSSELVGAIQNPATMNGIRVPDPAVLRGAQGTDDDRDGQSRIVPYRRSHSEGYGRGPALQGDGFDQLRGTKVLSTGPTLRLSLPPGLLLYNIHDQPQNMPQPASLTALGAAPPRKNRTSRVRLNRVQAATMARDNNRNEDARSSDGNASQSAFSVGNFKLEKRKVEHENRKRQITQILESILGSDQLDRSCVMLYWGKPTNCRVFPVMIPSSVIEDEEATWREIRRA